MIVVPANSPISGYNLTRSLRFRASASANLSQTLTTSATWALSVWVKRGVLGAISPIFGDGVKFLSNDTLTAGSLTTTAVYRDPSNWYHLYVSNLGLYINGILIGSVTTSSLVNPKFGSNGTNYFDGELAEFNFINGATPAVTAFGSFNSITGVWQPAKYSGSYPSGSSYVPFIDNSALTTSSNVGLGKDFSGNGNYWTTNNISITAGVTYDSMTDVPTLTSASAANFCVLNPLAGSANLLLANGNLQAAGTGTGVWNRTGTISIPQGKWYWEGIVTGGLGSDAGFGIFNDPNNATGAPAGMFAYLAATGNKYGSATSTAYGATWTTGDLIGVAFDATAGTLTFYRNNVSQGIAFTGITGTYFPLVRSTDTIASSSNFGQQPFSFTPPSGFVSLNTYNLPDSAIKQGNKVMDATLFNGTGAAQSIVNAAGFEPDLVWPKSRSLANFHIVVDSVRGATNYLSSNSTAVQATNANIVSSINSNGFSLGSDSTINSNGSANVAWQWQAGQGVNNSNTNGSITSTVSANPTAGFSIVTFPSQTSGASTVGHGLGVAPALILSKSENVSGLDWYAYHASLGSSAWLKLNTTDAAFSGTAAWGGVSPTSSVFTYGAGLVNTGTVVAYCWSEIAGYSKFGIYNGSAANLFVNTGFDVGFLMIKRTDAANSWIIWDSARNTNNPRGLVLFPDSAAAEGSGSGMYFNSNGFSIFNDTGAGINASGGSYVYAAFARNPFKYSLAR
jgi:hypothetical protein